MLWHSTVCVGFESGMPHSWWITVSSRLEKTEDHWVQPLTRHCQVHHYPMSLSTTSACSWGIGNLVMRRVCLWWLQNCNLCWEDHLMGMHKDTWAEHGQLRMWLRRQPINHLYVFRAPSPTPELQTPSASWVRPYCPVGECCGWKQMSERSDVHWAFSWANELWGAMKFSWDQQVGV